MDGCLGSAKAEQEDSQKSKSLWFKIHDQANTHAGCHWGEKFQTTTLARHNFINQVFTQDYMFKKNYIMVVTLAEFFFFKHSKSVDHVSFLQHPQPLFMYKGNYGTNEILHVLFKTKKTTLTFFSCCLLFCCRFFGCCLGLWYWLKDILVDFVVVIIIITYNCCRGWL